MGSLPSNTFMFNYNAKQYDSSTHTFPKTEGQLFDEDLVLNTAPSSYSDDYVDFGNGFSYMGKMYSSTSANPFNRTSNTNFTFIYKTSGWTNSDGNLFANRYGNYNYMVRGTVFHTSSGSFLQLVPNTNPQICVIRVYANGRSERKFVDSNGTVLQSVSASSISWGSVSDGIAFFAGYASGSENFNQKFYWMYCSMEALTDEEILKVIQYNEGNLIDFGPDVEELDFNANIGSETIELASDGSWSATTDSWITLSQNSGTTGGTITVSVAYNQFDTDRTGTVVFTNGEDTATLTVNQSGNTLAPIIKMFRNGRRIN